MLVSLRQATPARASQRNPKWKVLTVLIDVFSRKYNLELWGTWMLGSISVDSVATFYPYMRAVFNLNHHISILEASCGLLIRLLFGSRNPLAEADPPLLRERCLKLLLFPQIQIIAV